MKLIELLQHFKDPVLIEQLSFSDKIFASLFVTLLGMFITFTALIVLWGVTVLYSNVLMKSHTQDIKPSLTEGNSKIDSDEGDGLKNSMSNNINKLTDIEQVNNQDNIEKNLELVAVITSAIYATTASDQKNIRVRNIRRVGLDVTQWSQAGRIEQMYARMTN